MLGTHTYLESIGKADPETPSLESSEKFRSESRELFLSGKRSDRSDKISDSMEPASSERNTDSSDTKNLLPDLGFFDSESSTSFANAVYRPDQDNDSGDLLHLARSRSRGPNGRTIGREAGSHQGSKMWRGSSYGKWTDGGRYGCAAAATEVLQKAGVRIPDAGTVGQADSSLRRLGWHKTPLSQRGPGCVVIGYTAGTNWRKGGGNAHIGIVDSSGRVCNNESRGGGLWKCESLSGAIRPKYNRKYALCPPGR